MGHSIEQYQGKSVILNDGDLLLIVGAMIDQLARYPDAYPALAKLPGWLDGIRQGYGPGTIEIPIDRVAEHPEGIGQLASLLREVQVQLKAMGEILSQQDAERWAVEGIVWLDRRLAPAIAATEQLLQLIKDSKN